MKTVFFSFHRATIIVITLLHLLSRIISDIMQDISTPKEIVEGMCYTRLNGSETMICHLS